MCRKYPMTITEYRDNLAKLYPDYDSNDPALSARYFKAKYVYSDIKLRNVVGKWYDRDFGILTKPEDAFSIWWDC